MPTEFGTSGNDTLTGGQNGDTLAGLDGDDTLFGGSGQDSLFGGDGNDSLSGDGGDDQVFGGDGNDSMDGGTGQDRLYGGDGDDVIDTGDTANNKSVDTVYGGDGNDTILSSGNQDILNGEDDDDRFVVVADGSNFNNLTVNGGEDSDGADIDTLDLSGLKQLYPDLEITYESGSEGDEDARILIKTGPNGNELGRINYTGIEKVIICFTPGTMITTPRGVVPVQDLQVGDRVMTRDNGMQAIRWIGRRDLTQAELITNPAFQPVVVRAGALGPDVPLHDLVLSPSHRLLMTGQNANLLFGENEVLAAGKHLTAVPGIERQRVAQASYIHMMFDDHQVILSNGAWTESFQPGNHSLGGIGQDQRDEIFNLFPELATPTGVDRYQAARLALKKHEARLLTT